MLTYLSPDRHHVRETEFVRFLRSHLNDPDLITYFNRDTGEYVLAYWVYKDKGVVSDVEPLGPNMEGATRQLVQDLSMTRGPTDWAALKKGYLEKDRAAHRKQQELLEEHKDQYDYLKRKTGRQVPYMVG